MATEPCAHRIDVARHNAGLSTPCLDCGARVAVFREVVAAGSRDLLLVETAPSGSPDPFGLKRPLTPDELAVVAGG